MSRFFPSGIQNFWPEDTENCIYLENTDKQYSLQDIINICQEKWPGIIFSDLKIEARKIHTRCLTYDLHHHADWDNFIVITKN